MSVERENAVVNNTIILRNNFRYSSTNDLFDPSAVAKVEILDSNGTTIIETFTGASIVKDSTGKYHVVATAIAAAKTIYDKWYFTPATGATEITKTNTCVVWATVGEVGEVAVATDLDSMLAAVNTAIASLLAGGAVQSYSIGGRNIQKMTLNELRQFRSELQNEIGAGKGGGRTYVTFARPS